VIYKAHDRVFRAAAFDRLNWLDHSFGTRHSSGLAATVPLATLRQIHSAHCWEASNQSGRLGDGDALTSNVPGQYVGVRTADCVPVLLADVQTRAIAAVHAGWRGTAQRIVLRTLEHMKERYGARPENVVAAIGPAIGPCCYQVGPEVLAQLSPWVPELPSTEMAACLDLPEVNRRQLESWGVPPERITSAALCTYCRNDEFHSFRRDREMAGRMFAVIGLKCE
jgi:polyphenol oxidase